MGSMTRLTVTTTLLLLALSIHPGKYHIRDVSCASLVPVRLGSSSYRLGHRDLAFMVETPNWGKVEKVEKVGTGEMEGVKRVVGQGRVYMVEIFRSVESVKGGESEECRECAE